MTAQEIVDRIKKHIGVEWSSDDVDTFKAGDPSTIVTGVVTTSMATLDVLQKAVQAGANFVITAAPTFYSRADLSTPGRPRLRPGRGAGRGQLPAEAPVRAARRGAVTRRRVERARHRRLGAHAAGAGAAAVGRAAAAAGRAAAAAPPTPPPPDPVYAGKNDFIAKHKLVVFRLTQHWNQRKPDPRAAGPRGGDGLDEIQGRRRRAALRGAGHHARGARQPVEEERSARAAASARSATGP